MNLASSTVSQKQSNAERLMRCIVYILISFGCILHSLVGRIDYILTLAWGFRRCSFRLTGQCESLRIVERVTEWLCAFFLCINNNNPNNPAGAYRFYSFSGCIHIQYLNTYQIKQPCWSCSSYRHCNRVSRRKTFYMRIFITSIRLISTVFIRRVIPCPR